MMDQWEPQRQAGALQGQHKDRSSHTCSPSHTHTYTHTLMVVSPKPDIDDLNPVRVRFKSKLAERVQKQGPA